MSEYLDRPEQWDELARILRRARIIGLDTEFYGLDVRKQSCVGLARVHVWSVAVRTKRLHPRGFHRARGWVLPGAALTHPALRAVLEDASVTKCVHNQPVDDHAIHNHGVNLRGCVNTLGLARWVWPGLVTHGGFGLKNLMAEKLGREPICEFADVVRFTREVEVVTRRVRTVKRCECGTVGCRRRKGHRKFPVSEPYEVRRKKTERGEYPLESIVPGHERWDLLVRYAGEDAVAALEIEELARLTRSVAPFPYTATGRPGHSQAVEDELVAMERVGFNVDVEWCRTTVARAEEDEGAELAWLHRWYVANAPTEGPHRREEVDPIWSSPTKLIHLFDELCVPRSPVWKKGRVKRDEVKLDAAALEWIARNHPPVTKFVAHLLHLKRIRSGKKYLVKMRDSGGVVHPICGPAGDADDRNGAVTGRIGIKGTLEAQQLPTKEELDLYFVRKAIVA